MQTMLYQKVVAFVRKAVLVFFFNLRVAYVACKENVMLS